MGKKNTKGGKGHRKAKKNPTNFSKILQLKDINQEYSLITKKLGDCRFEGECTDGVKRLLHVRGKFRKRVWMNIGDYVLISLREGLSDQNKADIILKYDADDVRKLKYMKAIPEGNITKQTMDDEDDGLFDHSGGKNENTEEAPAVAKKNKKDIEPEFDWDDI